ncbi:MAG: transglutaminase domain-containing protein [Gemmatimonadetes bacterium]|nr:transglutaminase domain-containing protein [Gemmatimonadota bacterium]
MTGRGVVAIAVLTAWGAGIAAYAQHELARTPRERMAEIAARVAPGATYFAVERSGAHVGFASSTIDTVPGGLQVTDYLVADLAAEGGSRRTTAQSTVHLSRGLGLRDFTIVYGTASQRLRASGHTMGDTLLEYVVSTTEDGRAALTAGDSTPAGDTTRVRLTGPLLLPTLVPLVVALGEPPEVGQRHTMETFDPMTMSVRSLALTIRAESLFVVVDSAAFDTHSRRWLGAHADTVRGFRIVADDSATFDSWVDPLGRVITVHGPARLSLRRTAFEVAFENWRAAGKQRPAAGRSTNDEERTIETAVSAGVLGDAGHLDMLQLRIRGVDVSRLAIDGGGQRAHGDTITIAAFPAKRLRPTTPALPLSRAMQEQYARELRSEPLLEVAHPAIAALARRLRARDVLVDLVTQRLVTWVHDSLAKEPAIALPSAVATLRSRTGDSNEHAQLFVALARAAGIPARTVSGVVQVGGRFYYHAWAEVLLQEWVGADPTTGQFPVDASHVRLLVGGLGAHTELTRLVGRLDLTVLSQTSRRARRASTR